MRLGGPSALGPGRESRESVRAPSEGRAYAAGRAETETLWLRNFNGTQVGGGLIVPGRGTDRDLLSEVPGTQGNKHQQTGQFTACRDRIQAATVNVMCPHGWAKGARWLGKQCFWECLGVSVRAFWRRRAFESGN